jgi:23S rRNA G2069 N7-methylase RlmK/C1962 C5-methylase RlmI
MTNCKRLTQVLDENGEIIWGLDKYDKFGVIQAYADIDYKSLVKDFLEKHNLDGIYLKRRFAKKENSPHTQLIAGKPAPNPYYCIENDLKFEINFEEHLDVGLFLDHKIARELVGSYTKNKDVLNLFSYTGSFSLYSARNDANSVTSVDLSKNYIEWSKRNFIINNLDLAPHKFLAMDCFEFIDKAIENNETFDVIVIDPPSFSRNNQKTFQVQRDHKDFIRKIQNNLLRDRGFIFFSTNLRTFKLDPYLRPGADKLTKKTIPEEYKPFRPHQSYAFYN